MCAKYARSVRKVWKSKHDGLNDFSITVLMIVRLPYSLLNAATVHRWEEMLQLLFVNHTAPMQNQHIQFSGKVGKRTKLRENGDEIEGIKPDKVIKR